MIPTFVAQITAQTPPDSRPGLDTLLPPGQVRSARVLELEPLPGRDGGYRIRLLLGGRSLALDLGQPISPGSDIRILRQGSGRIAIGLPPPDSSTITPPPAARAAAPDSSPTTALETALREALPRQQPVADLLGRLSTLPLPATAAAQQAGVLIQTLLQLFCLRPGQHDGEAPIRRNVEQGGLFSEARLATALQRGEAPAPDLKTRLGRLLQLAEQLPPEARDRLQSLIDSLLARITARQLDSVARSQDLPDGSSERQFALDLPLRVGERHRNVTLEVRRHRSSPDSEAPEGHWRIRLQFDLEQRGPLDAELYLSDSGELNARFLAREAATVQLIETRLAHLSETLERRGMRVGGLHCSQGALQAGDSAIQRQLIDLHT